MKIFNNSFLGQVFAAVLFISLVNSCAPVKQPPPEPISPEQQNNLAMLKYEEILDEIVKRGKRNMLPELETHFREVINTYPKSYLAQESYWRLVEMNLFDYSPPRLDQAEQIRNEFIAAYPDSRMTRIIDDSIVRYYYKMEHWERLQNISSYHVRKYIESGKLETPLFMYYYAEAKFNLKDLVEAEKAYKIVIRYFPGSHEAKIAKRRIRAIKMALSPTDK